MERKSIFGKRKPNRLNFKQMANTSELQNLLQKIQAGEFQDMTNSIQKELNLTYLPDNNPTANLCLREVAEIRDEYRTHFSSLDLAFYLVGIDFEEKIKSDFNSAIPKSTEMFWENIRIGSGKT
ncbi:hypothetical protein Belba_2003 [Belliella baltica DSM 15883]|uniref:Uncharacterized protein n=2 Tax=Cyclobacteriaceae TaxID=563798 RepID=I3Z5Q9_BELBD|nr:hypothetical protein Belba_2003 [Belliella baltica DSM 15883]